MEAALTSDREQAGKHALLRAALVLIATGVVSASSVRHAIEEGGPDIPFAIGYALYLGLVLLATPKRTFRYAPVLAFVVVAFVYVNAVVSFEGGNDFGIAVYVIAGAFAYLATAERFRPLAVAGFALWTPALRFFGPAPAAGSFPPALALASVIALFNLVVVLLDRTAREPDERLRRIGLGLLGVACVATVVERHLVVASLEVAPDDLMAVLDVGLLPILAVVALPQRIRDALATGLALATFALVGMALLFGKGYHVDSVTVPHRAAELLIAGQNPYVTFDLPQALAEFGLDPQLVTHYEDGRVLHSLNYPSLSFLVVAPFVALGAADIRWIYLAEVLLLVLLVLRRVRIPWRPLVAAAVVGNTVIVRQNVLAGVDPTWALLVAVAWLFIDRRTLSAVAMGLAIASRQPAWFVAPFYLLAVWKRDGRRAAARAVGIAAIAAILPNLPFFLGAPSQYLDGIEAPMLGTLAPYGVGLVRFGVEGALPLLPRGVYGAISGASLLFLLWLLWKRWRQMPNGALVFPFVPLYLAWRSLQNYFGFVPIFALVGDEELVEGVREERPPSRAASEARLTVQATTPSPGPTDARLHSVDGPG